MSIRRRMLTMAGAKGEQIMNLPIGSIIKFSSGKTFILQAKNVDGHEPNSVTLCSEYIIEDAFWGGADDPEQHVTESYLYSDLHKDIMPRYYNELSELEKRAIICRKFEVHTYESNFNSGVTLKVFFSPSVESFFYIASLDEVRAKCEPLIDDHASQYPSYFTSGALGNYQYSPYDPCDIRKKTRENGSSGSYFTTTTRAYSNGNPGGGWDLYVAVVGEDGLGMADEMQTWTRYNGMRGTKLDINSGIVPFCDIKGDSCVKQEGDYWVFC